MYDEYDHLPPRVAFHVGPLRSANLEPFTNDKHRRTTGHLGTGLYVYLSADAIEWRSEDLEVVTVIENPWKRPFVIRRNTEEDVADDRDIQNFNGMSEDLAYLANTGHLSPEARFKSLEEVVQFCEPLWRKQRQPAPAYNLARLTEMAYKAIQVAKKSVADGHGIHPITLLLGHLGFDGIANWVRDDKSYGSVVFYPTGLKTTTWKKQGAQATRASPDAVRASAAAETRQYVAMMGTSTALPSLNLTFFEESKAKRARYGGRLTLPPKPPGSRAKPVATRSYSAQPAGARNQSTW